MAPPKVRDYKKEYKQQKARGPKEHERRMERQKARREMDAEGIDRGNKVIDHIKPLANGGSNAKSNRRLVSRSKNASFARKSNHKPK